MFIVVTRSVVEFEQDDPNLLAHRAFLAAHAATGRVLLSGPREPRIGGLTIYDMASEEEVQQLLAKDPMRIAGMLETEIFAFTPTITAGGEFDQTAASAT